MRIGIDLGGTKIEGVVLDREGAVIRRRRVPTPAHSCEAIVDALRGVVSALEAEVGPCSVGVGTPGAVSPATGRMKNSNTTCLNGQPLPALLEAALAREVRVANDANCFALSEATDGAGRSAEVVFGVILGTGTGGGVIVNRRPLAGANAIAGEWGHNPLPWAGRDDEPSRACYCGQRGCLETYLSGPGLSATHRARTGDERSAREIADAATLGDEDARRTLDTYVGQLGRGLASVINVLDPEVIVLGGGLSNVACLYAELPLALEPWVFTDELRTRILPPEHGDASGVRGAAWLWERDDER